MKERCLKELAALASVGVDISRAVMDRAERFDYSDVGAASVEDMVDMFIVGG